jgi:hypothetical protein
LTDWFISLDMPRNWEEKNASCVQNRTEFDQLTRNPTAVAHRNDTPAVSAARRSPRSRKNNTKTAGVSFTAAATPTSAPRGQRGPRTRQSATTSAINSALTWPKYSVSRTGSRASDIGSSAPTSTAVGRTASARSTSTSTSANAAIVTSAKTALASQKGTTANGANTTTANGG